MNNEQQLPKLSLVFDNKKINEESPWKDDFLKRGKYADALNQMINIAKPLTVSVNGKWGTGKTFLLRRWRQELENNGNCAIYFNAWTDDYCKNPLVSIIGQIAAHLKASENTGWKELAVSLLETAVPAVKALMGMFAPGTPQLIEGAEKTAEKIRERDFGKTLENYSESTENIYKLKTTLQKLAEQVQADTGHPLVFIVDELDRCRPTFAIEVLERIKHIFGVPGIMFVIGINGEELHKSIRQVYGDIDAADYLRRFYDYEIPLSEPKSSEYCRALLQQNNKELTAIMTKDNYKRNSYVDATRDLYPLLFDAMKLSLRDTEHCFRSLCFAIYNTADLRPNYGIAWPAICLIVLRLKNPELYRKFVRRESLSRDVIDYFHDFLNDDLNNDISEKMDVIEETIYEMAPPEERTKIEAEFSKLESSENPTLDEYPHLAFRSVQRKRKPPYMQGPFRDILPRITSALDLFLAHN